MERIQAAFDDARTTGAGALVIYVCAGDPSLEATREIVPAVARAGADIVELGIPYTDPIADGPTIQAAAKRSLQAGATVAGVLQCAAQIRDQSQVPLVIMSSVSPLFRFGLERFARQAAQAGVDGVLLSDLPSHESDEWCAAAATNGVATVHLVAPSSSDQRLRAAADRTTGFIYAVSRAGVTGARDDLPEGLPRFVGRIRDITDKPVAVGFGISTAQQVGSVLQIADGAVVGSAVVQAIVDAPDDPAVAAEKFVRGLVTP